MMWDPGRGRVGSHTAWKLWNSIPDKSQKIQTYIAFKNVLRSVSVAVCM